MKRSYRNIRRENRQDSGTAVNQCNSSRTAVLVLTGFLIATQLPANAEDQPINQYLDMDLTQLMQVTITSVSKKPQTIAETAAAVYVISQDDIRRSGVTTLAGALAMAPGVHVAQISSSKWSVSSRGFAGYTSNKLLVMIDGRSVYSPAFSGTFWDMPHTMLEDIDRIEVIRGPGGTVWGANAVNGVINIITKSAEDTQGTLVRAGVGSHEKYTAAARYGGKINETTAGRFYVTTNDRGSFSLDNSDRDAGDDWQNTQTGFRLDGELGSATEWTVQGDAYKNTGNQLISPYWLPSSPYLIEKETDLDNKGANLTTNMEHLFDNGQKLSAQLYYDYNKRNEDPYSLEFKTFDLELQYDMQLGSDHNITLGSGYRNVDSSFEESFQLYLPDSNYDLFSAFIQDEIHLVDDRLIATFGVKWEHNDFTGNEWQPSAKLLWKVKENHSLWTSVSRAVRTPSIVEDSGSVVLASYPTPAGTGTFELNGNNDFESEVVYAYEAGYRWQTSATLSTDIALFYNDYDSLYNIRPSSISRTATTFGNEAAATSYGLDAALKWRPKEWISLDLTYSYLNFDLDQAGSTALDLSSSVLATTSPKNQFGVRSSFDITKQWEVNGWLRYQDDTTSRSSSQLYETEIPVDSFFVLDVNVIWKPRPNLEIMVAGQNLLNTDQLQYAAEAISPPTEVARGVYGKITWSF